MKYSGGEEGNEETRVRNGEERDETLREFLSLFCPYKLFIIVLYGGLVKDSRRVG